MAPDGPKPSANRVLLPDKGDVLLRPLLAKRLSALRRLTGPDRCEERS